MINNMNMEIQQAWQHIQQREQRKTDAIMQSKHEHHQHYQDMMSACVHVNQVSSTIHAGQACRPCLEQYLSNGMLP